MSAASKTELIKKLSRGEPPSDADWTEHLIEAHRASPGMTPRGFASLAASDGRSSYRILADSVPPPSVEASRPRGVVDLACGDGHLVRHLLPRLGARDMVLGVDMSEGELTIARAAYADPRVRFHCGKAHELPVDDGSVDHVLCHLALMLMAPIEPVIAEVARVLVPHGRFTAILDRRTVADDLWGALRARTGELLHEHYPGLARSRAGDARVDTEEGLASLFGTPAGFTGMVAVVDHELSARLTPEGVWDFIKETYFVGFLPPDAQESLRSRLLELVRARLDEEGFARLVFPVREVTAIRSDRAL